jgi:membrane-associated protease RseP (regulator of RpoE activity)
MAAIMSILLAHEMGHYLACRHYGIDASLPYFIPFPNLFGTMGAFIRIRAPIHNRGALLDVGIAGPIAGFVVAVFALAFSIGKALPLPVEPGGEYIGLGEPLMFKLVATLLGPELQPGMDSFLHPVSVAAWFGLFVTALNLLPVGQLDGGHVAYAISYRLHRWISRLVAAAMLGLGLFYWAGWLPWFALLLIIRLAHPPTLNDFQPLARRHVLLAWAGLAIFALCFVPMPFIFGS